MRTHIRSITGSWDAGHGVPGVAPRVMERSAGRSQQVLRVTGSHWLWRLRVPHTILGLVLEQMFAGVWCECLPPAVAFHPLLHHHHHHADSLSDSLSPRNVSFGHNPISAATTADTVRSPSKTSVSSRTQCLQPGTTRSESSFLPSPSDPLLPALRTDS